MQFYVGNKLLEADLTSLLCELRLELNDGRFKSIGKDDGKSIQCTCPFHKDGKENHPSFGITSSEIKKLDGHTVPAGYCHCLTCGYKGNLSQMISDCFEMPLEFGEDWLISKYGDIWIEKELIIPELILDNKEINHTVADESELNKYRYYHPYMFQRKLTKEVIDKFEIGYDKECDAITFPVRNINGEFLFVTKRNVKNKQFYIPKLVDKPVYLLYNIIKEGNDTAYICESQINGLTLWSWGYPGCSLFGTGSETQYEILKHSGIRHFVLCFDGDDAGRKGADRFKAAFKNLPVFIDDVIMPYQKDVNDLNKAQFEYLKTTQTSKYI